MKWLVVGAMVAAICGEAHGRQAADARLVAARSTKTAIILVTTTTTAPLTCAVFTNQVVCQRRRFMRFSSIPNLRDGRKYPALDSTLADMLEVDEEGDREKRLSFTLWSTTSTTISITSTSINSDTTFSLSFLCTVNNAAFPPACG